jgi:hypothetical protein
MIKKLFGAPWCLWLAGLAGCYCAYLFYLNALGMRIFVSGAIIPNPIEEAADQALRLIGLALLILSVVRTWQQSPNAIWVALGGTLLFLAPWFWLFSRNLIAQASLDIAWAYFKQFPVFTWRVFLVPVAIFLIITLANRQTRANKKLQLTSRPRNARPGRG